MEVGGLLLFRTLYSPPIRLPLRRHSSPVPFSPLLRASSSPLPLPSPPSAYSQGAYRGPKPQRDLVSDWVSNNDGFVRSLPIFVGGLALLAVLLNRTFSGISPVADASSSQSRADILTLALAVTNLLSGLVWLSIRPKYISPVVPQGVECKRINSKVANYAVLELLWVWESLSATTCCRSLVVVHGGYCLLQIGIAAESLTEVGEPVAVDVHKLIQSPVYRSVIESRKQSYLANLSLYPARSELSFLPINTQAVILQPLGNSGIAIIGGDTIRGFTNLDQIPTEVGRLCSYDSNPSYLQDPIRRRRKKRSGGKFLLMGNSDHQGMQATNGEKLLEMRPFDQCKRGKAWITLIAEKLDVTLSKSLAAPGKI